MPVAFYGGAHDDLLFVQQAAALLNGHWSGPFGSLTLAKGPGFPLFLAACARLHLPPHVGEEAVLLAASWLAADVAARLAGHPALRLVAFALLAANPAPLDLITTDLMREPLYAGLLLGVLALGGRLFLLGAGIPTAVALGLVFAVFWATRQEGVLVLPALALMAGFRLVRDRRLLTLLVPAVAAAIPLFAICLANERAYGVFRIDDMTAGPFPAAYGALARVGDASRERYVPVPRDARLLAYRASPSAATLAPYLEGAGGRYWAQPGCGENPITGCGDKIQAGWFMWALREAAVAAGHYRDARETDRFWRRVAAELDAACAAHTISCTARRDTLQPPLRARDIGPVLHEAGRAALAALRLGPPHLGTYPTRPFADAATYRRAVRAGPVAPRGLDISRTPPLRGVHGVVARVLCGVMPVLTVLLAPLGAIGVLLRRGHASRIFGAAALLVILCRIAMLAVLSATAIRLQFRYVSPVFPEVILVAVLGLCPRPRQGAVLPGPPSVKEVQGP